MCIVMMVRIVHEFVTSDSYKKIQNRIHRYIPDSSIIGMDGKERGVYYFILDNGWYSVITIPFSKLLEPMKDSWGIFLLVMLIFFLLLVNVFNFGVPGKTQGGAL